MRFNAQFKNISVHNGLSRGVKSFLIRIRNSPLLRLFLVGLLVLGGLLYFADAYGAQLPNRSLLIGDSRTSTKTNYQFSFDLPSSETLGSIQFQICANDPLVGDPCTAPAGFDMSAATLTAQSGITDFTVLPTATTANTIVLTHPVAPANPMTLSYTFSGVTNPSTSGTYYGRIQTFATNDATGSYTDYGGVAFSITNEIKINTTVPPYLLFCTGITISALDCTTASGNYVNFGILSSQVTSNASTQMVMATNADTGFALYANGNTMTSGNNTISALATNDVSRPGVSQFGINLVANQTPSVGENPSGPGTATATPSYRQPNFYRFVPGEAIISAGAPSDYQKFTVSYIVNVPASQPPGVYVTTLTYVCLANF